MALESHEINWTPEKIALFWNRLGTDNNLADLYFSKQKGAALLTFAARHTPLEGNVVDLGCGPGYLIDQLLKRGVNCRGADFSGKTVQALNRRLAGNRNFHGVKVCNHITDVPFPDESIDLCFFIEALEHLLPETRDEYLGNILKALVPGGRLVMTMPCAENLEAGKVICPDCGCRFHRVQHVASYSQKDLRILMAEAGYSTIVCRPVLLLPDWQVYLSGLRANRQSSNVCPECGMLFKVRAKGLRRFASKACLSNLTRLVYVGKKPALKF